mmetsp:Transcript_49249/g.137965  ORF Transcript_49249/g.137965 Transcript_49249/m.137965 type:complete len:238 (-) Transcript_49249:117-830(-)
MGPPPSPPPPPRASLATPLPGSERPEASCPQPSGGKTMANVLTSSSSEADTALFTPPPALMRSSSSLFNKGRSKSAIISAGALPPSGGTPLRLPPVASQQRFIRRRRRATTKALSSLRRSSASATFRCRAHDASILRAVCARGCPEPACPLWERSSNCSSAKCNRSRANTSLASASWACSAAALAFAHKRVQCLPRHTRNSSSSGLTPSPCPGNCGGWQCPEPSSVACLNADVNGPG